MPDVSDYVLNFVVPLLDAAAAIEMIERERDVEGEGKVLTFAFSFSFL